MNKKRAFYLLALLLILAAIIVPTVLNSNHSGSGHLVKTETPADSNGNTPAAEKAIAVEDKAVAPTPAATSDAKNQTEQAESTPEVPVKDGSVQNPPEQHGCRVYIAVVGLNGEIVYHPAAVNVTPGNRWGITALGALDATGLSYAMKPMWPDFVDSIGGQACKGVSGWMYMVNGEIPMHLADKHPVKDGDKVIWWYSESMDQEPPSWDKLKN